MALNKQKAPHKMTVNSADSSPFQYQPQQQVLQRGKQGRFKGVCYVLCMASAVYV